MEIDLIKNIIAKKIMPTYLEREKGDLFIENKGNDFERISYMISNLRSAERIKDNFAFRPIFSHRKILGKSIVFIKRVIRKILKWYIEPICFQQSDYNSYIVKAVYESSEIMRDLIEKNDRLSNEISILKEKIKNLEEKR